MALHAVRVGLQDELSRQERTEKGKRERLFQEFFSADGGASNSKPTLDYSSVPITVWRRKRHSCSDASRAHHLSPTLCTRSVIF